MDKIKKVLRSKIFIITASVILVYTLAGFFLTPFLIRHYLPETVRKNLKKEAGVSHAAFNPYLFKLELQDFHMQEPNGEPIFALDRILVDFELKSLFRWAWIFQKIELDRPVLNTVIQKTGALNLAQLAPNPGSDAPARDESTSQPPRFLLESIRIAEGCITFTDRRSHRPAAITLTPVQAEIGNLGTLPESTADTTIHAVSTAGETFEWTGRVGLNPLTVNGRMKIQAFKSATAAAFAGDKLLIAPPAGTISAEADCIVEGRDAPAQIVLSDLSLGLDGIAVALPNAETPLLKLPEARIRGARVDLTGRRIDLGTLTVKGGGLHLAADPDGVLNLQRVTAHPESRPEDSRPPSEKPQTENHWSLQLAGFEIGGFTLQYSDSRHSPGFRGAVRELAGRFSVEARFGGTPSALVKNLMVHLSDIEAGFTDAAPIVAFDSFSLQNGAADLAQKRLSAVSLSVDGGTVQLERRSDGTLNIADLAGQLRPPESNRVQKPAPAGDPHAADPAGAAEALSSKPDNEAAAKAADFQFQVERASVSGIQAAVWDRTVLSDRPILRVESFSAAASQIDGHSPMPIELDASLREGGRIKASGTFDPGPLSLAAEITVTGLALATARPYVTPAAAVDIASGTVSTAGTVHHAGKDAEARTVYQGGFTVENLNITDVDGKESLVGWRSLVSEHVKLLLQPNGLDVKDIRIQGLIGKTVVEKDGSFNLSNVIKTDDAPESSQAAAPRTDARDPAYFSYRIGRVLVDDGRIDFADHSLRIPFAAKIQDLKGNVVGLASAKENRSRLMLKGRVDEYGTARVEGEVNTSDPRRYTDIELAFRNIEMTTLTPYSGKFAGRRIDSGKLSVDLGYEIEDSRLKGDNRIIVEHLELGEKIESSDAVNLPLDLAVALLKDSKGVIDLGLPVSGDLNSPQFSFGALIGKAFLNLLTKIVTSPFRILGALIPGGGGENIDRIGFEPGHTGVPPPEQEKLHHLAEALAKRPQLKLVVQGRFHPQKDADALARHALRNAVAVRLGQSPSPIGDAVPIDFSSPDTRNVLQTMFAERLGSEPLKSFLAERKEAAEKEKDADAGFIAKALFERLLSAAAVSENRLMALADARAEAVIAEMAAADSGLADRMGSRASAALPASAPITAALDLQALE